MGVGDQLHAPAALPPGITRYPLYRRLGRLQGRSGRVLKISPPPGFDPRTVQLVASRLKYRMYLSTLFQLSSLYSIDTKHILDFVYQISIILLYPTAYNILISELHVTTFLQNQIPLVLAVLE
jgi:hypothetical protein